MGGNAFADSAPTISVQSESEYREFVEKTELPEDFVYYRDEWSVLGTFAGITSYSNNYESYWYYLTGKNNLEFMLRIRSKVSQLSDVEVLPESNLRFNSNEKAFWVYCQVGKLQYYYGDGTLSYIRWFEQSKNGIMEFIFSFDHFDEYPQTEGDLCSSLLSLETAENAGEQLISIVRGEKNAFVSFPWLWVGIGGGAAVVIGGALAAALIVRKKRRKTSAAPCG
jgi:hypothetical protein